MLRSVSRQRHRRAQRDRRGDGSCEVTSATLPCARSRLQNGHDGDRRADDDFDAIVVGAGHNGLVCAAYLAKAGLRTLLVEARAAVGGTAASESFAGGTVNICNCDHITFRTTPVIEELGLADHGLRYIDIEPAQRNMAWDDDRAVARLITTSSRRSTSLARTHPAEVDGYRRYLQGRRCPPSGWCSTRPTIRRPFARLAAQGRSPIAAAACRRCCAGAGAARPT